jgi:dTDP-4-dehydrorhamnose 3,5-epimerase
MHAEHLLSSRGQPMPGLLLLTPELFPDARGFLYESWNQRRWQQLLSDHGQRAVPFVQDNHSRSSRGVLRGLHYQLPPHGQAKLVRCVQGEIFDVAVDLRPHSPGFGQWVGVLLSERNHRQLWLPEGFAHGFLTLSSQAEVLYRASNYWAAACERAIRWDDPQLQIDWPLAGLGDQAPLLSAKDADASTLDQAESVLEFVA